jgi:flavin-dependent dehydrogenase
MTSADVLVVGGGPAGAAVAFELARSGVDVLVVDRAAFPRPKPCAEYLSPQASRILHAMGVLAPIERSGAAQLTGIEVRAPNGFVIRGDFDAPLGFTPFRSRGLSVRREVLDAILIDAARSAGARVAERVRVTGLERDQAGRVVGATLLDGEAIRARMVVGADGLRSVVARRLGLARHLRWPRRISLVTHYTGVGDVGERGEMHVERDGFVGIADVGNGVTTVALVVSVSRSREVARDRTAFLSQWLMSRPHLRSRFSTAKRASPVVATGPFASHARRAWAPGVALVGDAADFFDPFTGEGIYSALRGGEMLAPAIVAALGARDPRRADVELARYDRMRRAEFGGKWVVERAIGAVVGWAPLINRAARRLAQRKRLADLLIGVTGDFVPAREVIRLSYLWNVFGPSFASDASHAPQT